MKKVVVILSGGMDSSLTAFKMRYLGFDIVAVHFSYGQRTENRERQAFRDIADEVGAIRKYEIELPFFSQIGVGVSALLDNNLELNTKGVDTSSIPNSYVPFRNGIMLSIATAIAEKEDAVGIAIGAVEEDSSGYPDCRESFISKLEDAINLGTKKGNIQIFRPLIALKKETIVKEAIKYKVPLQKTWSCYQREDIACGVCDSCRLRLKGFALAQVEDPIQYDRNPYSANRNHK